MKKTLNNLLLLGLIAICFILFAPGKNVNASSAIIPGQWISGMTNGTNKNIYTYKMQSSGYFYYQILLDQDYYYHSGERTQSSSFWVYTDMDSNYKSYIDKDRAHYSDGIYTSPKYSFKAGQNVNISVYDADNYETPYKIRVIFKKMKNFEKENNNIKKRAHKLKRKKTYTGCIIRDDVDWFVFKAPKTKYYRIYTVCLNKSYSEPVDVYLGYKNINNTRMYGGDGWTRVFGGRLKKGQKIYVKIYNGDSNAFYKIKAK